MSKPLFWTCDDDAETLSETDMDNAIEQHLDALWPMLHEYKGNERKRIDAFLAGLPKELEVYGFTRTKIGPNQTFVDIDEIMERIEEDELGDPDGGDWEDRMKPEQVEAIKGAARLLDDAIRANYVPWACERTTTVKVDPVAWIKEHCPNWLEVSK